MDTFAMALFLDVAARGSFAAVARARDTDPSSISRAIAGLEAELGARVFQRTTRAMVLTEAGDRFRERIAPLVAEFERARDEAASSTLDPAGIFRLTASVSFGETMLVPLITAFRAAFPRLVLELLLTDANLDLVEERIDLAIRLGPSYGSGVIGAKLLDTRYRLVASPAYLSRTEPLAAPAALATRDCVLFPMPEYRNRWRFRQAGKIEEVPVHGAVVISSGLAVRTALLDGIGPGLIADFLIGSDLASGRLVDLFPDHDVTATSFETAAWLLYSSRAHLPTKVRAVIDFLRDKVVSKHGLGS